MVILVIFKENKNLRNALRRFYFRIVFIFEIRICISDRRAEYPVLRHRLPERHVYFGNQPPDLSSHQGDIIVQIFAVARHIFQYFNKWRHLDSLMLRYALRLHHHEI